MTEPPVVNIASADAQATVSQKESITKPKPIEEPPAKKKRFNDKRGTRHGGTSYEQQNPITSLQIVPRCRLYPVYVSNHGCRELARHAHLAIQGRDYRLAATIPELQLAYVMNVAFCNRIAQCGLEHGYAFPVETSRLKQVASGIQLPSVLAQYIESIGLVQLASGATVAPFVEDYGALFANNRMMTDPAAILREAGRPIPAGPWALDIEWIVGYNDATTRASRSGMKFRTVDVKDLRGRVEMTVSYVRQDDMLLPCAPQVMSEAEAQLGAIYLFRDYRARNRWPGLHGDLLHDTFVAIPFEPRIVFSDLCVAAFKGMQITNA